MRHTYRSQNGTRVARLHSAPPRLIKPTKRMFLGPVGCDTQSRWPSRTNDPCVVSANEGETNPVQLELFRSSD